MAGWSREKRRAHLDQPRRAEVTLFRFRIEVRPPERVVRPELDRRGVRTVVQSPLRDAENAGSESSQAVGRFGASDRHHARELV